MKLINAIVAIGTTLLLALCLIAAGLAAVAIPDAATEQLSRAFSGCEQPSTPFSKDELASMAIAGKRYTFDDNNPLKLALAIDGANDAVEADGRAGAETRTSETRCLTDEAKSHLDDVYHVVRVAKPALLAALIVCIAGLAHVRVRISKRALGVVCAVAGGLVIASFAGMGAWAAVDFLGMFNLLHSFLFSQGSWTFAYDSLLITLYPTEFWMGMGAIWLAVTGVLSILSLFIGLKIGKTNHGR